MDDSEQPLRLMIVKAVNECTDAELLDLIYKLLICESGDGESSPASAFLLFKYSFPSRRTARAVY